LAGGAVTLLGGALLANVEGFVTPVTFDVLGVLDELNGLLLCQGMVHLPPL
jgi:hypothetical protein